MSDRKQSPDVLAELLGAELPPSPAPALEPKAPARAQSAQPRSESRKAQPPAEPRPARTPQPVAEAAPAAWETEIVTCQQHRGWRPRYVNGVECKDWLTGPLIHDYLRRRGAEGWELAGTTAIDRFYGAADNLQLYFKNRK
jgi:hypothetical protein